ncbi:hypothetical protein [Flavobacterium sp.]|uniref:hypothetical protein n=1 Tax=Flavobacterium sp. TaxID=239 RepID=UPI002615A3DC|nr:hypothetical protein [Flavobacterium sp.]MDD3004015.1 hypothetical protein [Flavobacterium sp.]MDD3004451.1 hypothetical protein [Flavobacterium sp.]
MKLSKLTKPFLMLAFFFVVSSVSAQFPEEPGEDPDDSEAPLDPAPISDYLIPMLLVGVATAFVLLKRQAPTRA